jgi:hypothetical protein
MYVLTEEQRTKKREYDLQYQRNRRKTPEYRQWNLDYKKNHPAKIAAHHKIAHAIEAGKLKRLPCEVCGDDRPYRVHAHHDDYSMPLAVRWLCVPHHKLVHSGR